MFRTTMTVFILPLWKNAQIKAWGRGLLALMLALTLAAVWAQPSAQVEQYLVERVDDDILLSAQIHFDLPAPVEDALTKGIPIIFTLEAEVVRERWYWYDKKLSMAARSLRLVFQPLTRRWRLGVSGGGAKELALNGQPLNQTFASLDQALGAIRRISRWKIADAAELDAGQTHKVDLRFQLDLTQLPRPFQIGALGQSDWDLSVTASTSLVLGTGK